jgi:hypothetical protein
MSIGSDAADLVEKIHSKAWEAFLLRPKDLLAEDKQAGLQMCVEFNTGPDAMGAYAR